jgi:hypothetical protein
MNSYLNSGTTAWLSLRLGTREKSGMLLDTSMMPPRRAMDNGAGCIISPHPAVVHFLYENVRSQTDVATSYTYTIQASSLTCLPVLMLSSAPRRATTLAPESDMKSVYEALLSRKLAIYTSSRFI